MNRNTSSRFSLAPQVAIERSKFNRDSTVTTSFNVGDLIPFYVEEVLPGDTFKIKTSKIARMQTLKTPMMDDIYMDTYYFFVPNRLVWKHWQAFMGENEDSAWIPQVEYTIPQLLAPSGGWSVNTIADYMGIPIGVSNLSVNALPFRAYALICNDWFRDENLQDPIVIDDGDSAVQGVNTGNQVTDIVKGGLPFIANKSHDYFTSALPAPQKGPDTQLQLVNNGLLDVWTTGVVNDYYGSGESWNRYPGDYTLSKYEAKIKGSYPVLFDDYSAHFNAHAADPTKGRPNPYPLAHKSSVVNDTSVDTKAYDDLQLSYIVGTSKYAAGNNGEPPFTMQTLQEYKESQNINNYRVATPVNLVAGKLGSHTNAFMVSINELRTAFQIQRFYEKQARGGSRYIEVIKSHFGVTSPDARMQRPEYLGGNRLPLNVRQITQTSSTTENSPMGDVAGMSVTTDNNFDFEKSFTEHGYIIGVCVCRYHHTYQQGIDRTFSRKTIFDYYWPTLAHLGEQAIKNKEIYAQGTNADNEVFGYQEAWAEYRYKPNRVSGLMRSDANSSLDSWHLADDYNSLPTLSASWIREDKSNVDRVLAVTSNVSNQIFADILVQNEATRPMPLYSIPGLIDHF